MSSNENLNQGLDLGDLEELVKRAENDAQDESENTATEEVFANDSSNVVSINGGDNLEDRVQPRILETEMESSYLTYAMSVIVSRALPDVRDGLKPVHRRILYAMHKMGLVPGGRHKKSATVVGEVLGKYHPHGDSSVYGALARLAQDFSMRYQLIDGQGNFGSIDGDSPAAMRYTECKMNKPTPFILNDIEKDTVEFVDNYDGSHTEPTVLPTRFPNLLVNGQTGIAVGMATEIPPHNLAEVMEALIALIKNPELDIDQLMEYIKGPDLPTGAIIYGKAGIVNAYKTGRGKCTIRAKAELTEDRVIITEIPYQLNKSDLIIKIAELVKDKKIEGIRDLRDESNKDGIRVVIETKRDASPEVVLNQLYKQTELQKSVHFNMVALQGGRQPKTFNLKEMLEEFLAHREDVVVRRTKFDLAKAEAELHILDGLKIALDNIDRVIQIIRGSYDKEEASQNLIKEFSFSEKQTEAILQMRLQTLTNLDKGKIEEQRNIKIELIKSLKEILENPEVKQALIIAELQEVSDKINSPRRTQIFDHEVGDYNKEDFIESEDVVVQLTKDQYAKYIPLSDFRLQGRGGRGVTSINAKDNDYIIKTLVANTHDFVYAFTNTGRIFKTRVFDLPLGSRTSRGQNLINYLELQAGEKIANILTVTKEQEESLEGSVIFATKMGIIKRTRVREYQNTRKTGIIAITLNEGDAVIGVALSNGGENEKVVLSADNGKTVIFDMSQISFLGRSAKGVKGMRLKKNENLISLEISDFEFAQGGEDDEVADGALIAEEGAKQYPSLLVVSENGFGKQTYLGNYRKTNRAAGGVKTMNITRKTGKPVVVQILKGEEENLLVVTKGGIMIRIDPLAISQLGRNTQGVKIINLEKDDEVISGGVN